MVDPTKKNPVVASEVAALVAGTRMSNAAVSRELRNFGGQASAAGVGKWIKTGQISRKNMDALRALAAARKDYPTQAEPSMRVSVQEPAMELRMVLLRNAVSSINRALGAMAVVLAKTRPTEAHEVLSLFDTMTPTLLDDDGISEMFRNAMHQALEASPTDRRKKSHPAR